MPLLLKVLLYKGLPLSYELTARFDESGGSVGRSPDNHFVLPDRDKRVSRKHASIVFRDGSYFLTDTSTGGTYFVNRGEWLQEGTFALRDLERFQIGEYEIKVFLEAAPLQIDHLAILDAFFEGLGMDLSEPIKDEDLLILMKTAGVMLRNFVEGMMTVLRTRAEVKFEMRLAGTSSESPSIDPLKSAVNVDDALKMMLTGAHPSSIDPVEAVRSGFADLMHHQFAMAAGIQAALEATVQRFDPHRYEKFYEHGIVFQKKAKCWDAYTKAYPELVREISENFFGVEFAETYEQRMQVLRSTPAMREKPLSNVVPDSFKPEKTGRLATIPASDVELPGLDWNKQAEESALLKEDWPTVPTQCEDPFAELGDGDKTVIRPTPGGRRRPLDEVHLAVSAPRFVKPDAGFITRFAAYIQEREEEVKEKIKVADQGRSEFIPQPETCRWKRGAPVRVRVVGDSFTAIPTEHTFEWDGREAIKSFQVRPKSDVPIGPAQLGFEVCVADFPEAWLWVEIQISNAPQPFEETKATGLPTRRAFASYASADLSDVLARISAIAAWDQGLDIFYSWLDLVEGENWEDRLEKELTLREVLLLFWSRNAKASKWVEWEWRTMLRTKGVRAIQPVPIEPPEIAIPPEELASHINFRDRYLVAREAAQRIAELKAKGT